MFGSSLSPIVCVCIICVSLRSVGSNTYCVVFLFVLVLCLVCPMLPVSLDCPFLIAHSVFSNIYLQQLRVNNIVVCHWSYVERQTFPNQSITTIFRLELFRQSGVVFLIFQHQVIFLFSVYYFALIPITVPSFQQHELLFVILYSS